MVKLLIVDDSALMRKHLNDFLSAQEGFVVRTARNGAEALLLLEEFDPDVITLDVNMPEMDGITCLSRIMVTRPKPVIMLSSLTEEGAETTLQALSLGAVDFVQKPGGTISLSLERVHNELLAKIRAAARARVKRTIGLKGRLVQERTRISGRNAQPNSGLNKDKLGLVLVGVSTGGPGTLEEILPKLPADFPWPIVIAQHMPGSFTAAFARRLNDLCQMHVVEAHVQCPVERGVIYIARGDADATITKRAAGISITPMPAARECLWHPSVHRLVTSAMTAVPAERLVGVQLTGMGDDGAEAMAKLHSQGGFTIAQDAETCVVFGMPNELIRKGGASVVLPSDQIARQLVEWICGSNLLSSNQRGRNSAYQTRN